MVSMTPISGKLRHVFALVRCVQAVQQGGGHWAARREPRGGETVHFPGEQGGGCQGHSRESAESRSRAEGGKAERTARGCWGGEGWRPVPAPPADLQLQHRHSALVTGEDGWHPLGNSSGPAETEFNVCRREQGQGTSVGNSLLQGPETPIC